MGAIRINQMGYSPNSSKQVVYVGSAETFQIYNTEDNRLCDTGGLSKQRLDQASQELVCTGDFSRLNQSGSYYIMIHGEKSPVFWVSDRQPVICTDAMLKALYYQRCGMELTEQYAGRWKHSACHLQPSYLFRQDAENLLANHPEQLVKMETCGGWHDAGDYGRYTIAMAKTIADLLLAYEHFKEVFDHSIDIPESTRKGADILYEAKYGLDFLLKLQRESDGAVYTKVTTRYFPGMIMPQEDTKPLYVFDVSSPATADFTAVMAMAAKLYEDFDPVFASKCLQAAERSYQWLKQNQEPLLFKNQEDILSGEYGDDQDIDERYWAAAQMYRTTGEEKYHSDFLLLYFMLKDKLTLGWKCVGGYGTIAYLCTSRRVNNEVYQSLEKEWLSYSERLALRSREDCYGITLAREEYQWGSMMMLMNQSMHLIMSEHLCKKNTYDPIIHHNWDYLFGMNPMDTSYVSGLGEHAVTSPHHRPSAADGVKAPVPGLVSGGPCAYLQDEVTQRYCQGKPPAKCFVDHVDSYSTNEVDTYWNSPAVYVGAYICSQQL